MLVVDLEVSSIIVLLEFLLVYDACLLAQLLVDPQQLLPRLLHIILVLLIF